MPSFHLTSLTVSLDNLQLYKIHFLISQQFFLYCFIYFSFFQKSIQNFFNFLLPIDAQSLHQVLYLMVMKIYFFCDQFAWFFFFSCNCLHFNQINLSKEYKNLKKIDYYFCWFQIKFNFNIIYAFLLLIILQVTVQNLFVQD